VNRKETVDTKNRMASTLPTIDSFMDSGLIANNTATVSSKHAYSAETPQVCLFAGALLGDLEPAVDDRRISIVLCPSALRDER
jgi:hypothetical protein